MSSTRTRTTCSDSFSGSREILPAPSSISSVRSRSSQSPPRLTTTSVSPSGIAARRIVRWRNSGGAAVSIPPPEPGASQAFLGPALRDTGDLPRARASLQRAIALLPPTAAVYVDLGITYVRAGEIGKALGQLEPGLNLAPPPGPMPDWDAAIGGLRQALGANAQPADAAN